LCQFSFSSKDIKEATELKYVGPRYVQLRSVTAPSAFNRFNLAGIGELEQAYQNQLLPYTGTPRFVALFCDICWDNRTGNLVASVASLASTNDMLRDPNFVLVSTPEYASDPEFTQLDVHLW
jgi:hypothetical protein